VIKSSGHLIGPFEVESVLLEHPAVAHVGVIGKPIPSPARSSRRSSPSSPASSPHGSSRRNCSHTHASGWAPSSLRRSSRSWTRCRPRGAARSCGGC
jgi:acyl-CoA synthetase (AMP-forming)/AMP-acid ligase II